MDASNQFSRDELLLLLNDLMQVNAEQQERIKRLEEEIARLKNGGSPPSKPRELPAFVKPNRKTKDPKKEKPARKQRLAGFARKRQTPTRIVEHYPHSCTDCGRKLKGGWVHSSRQIIEIPAVPVEVIQHQFMARHCGVCNRRVVARPNLSSEAIGQSRLGVRLMSFISYLDTMCRMPLAGIQRLLAGLYSLHLSEGEIVRVLHQAAKAGQSAYDALLTEIRKSAVVYSDETGSRENGINGYLWSLSNENTRYYYRDQSRSAGVIQKLLGYSPSVLQAGSARKVREAGSAAREAGNMTRQSRFRSVLVTDFYAAYSWYGRYIGWHQRCLVHLKRDLDALKAEHIQDPGVCRWVESVNNLLHRAKEYAKEHSAEPDRFSPAVRRSRRIALEKEVEDLSRPYCRSVLPQHTLAERLYRHRSELFVFVHHLDVPSSNNAAERAIRPFVVMRKVSGGTRSAAGSHTQAVLLSLFSTWVLRGLDPLEACRSLLTNKLAFQTT